MSRRRRIAGNIAVTVFLLLFIGCVSLTYFFD
jgi:hypothetical protein